VVELKNVMFKSLYTWISAYNNMHFSSSSNFWIFVLFLYIMGSLLYISCVLELHPYALSNEIKLLLKKLLKKFCNMSCVHFPCLQNNDFSFETCEACYNSLLNLVNKESGNSL
jgi:hypothetical protein